MITPRKIRHMLDEAFFNGPYKRGVDPNNHYIKSAGEPATYTICSCKNEKCGTKIPKYEYIQVI